MGERLPERTAEEIAAHDDIDLEPQQVPEWGSTVYLRTLPGGPGLELRGQIGALPADKDGEALFLLLAQTLVDAKGQPLLTAEQLRKKRLSVLARLNKRALELQGWREVDSPGKAVSGSEAAQSGAASTA